MTDKKFFIDTNVWLYAFIRSDDHHKNATAKRLIKSHNIAISSQVINELCVNLLKKTDLREEGLAGIITSFYNRYNVIESSKDLLLNASTLRRDYRFSYWDSLIVSAALHAQAELLYTEDMHDGLMVRKTLRITQSF